MFKLKELVIAVVEWGNDQGAYRGKTTFTGDRGEITLNLNDEHIEQIFTTCASSIEETAKAAARFLHVEISEQRAKRLTAKKPT